MRRTCLDMIYELAREDDRIVFIGSDLGFGTLNRFRQEMPERFFMEGINEAHAVGMAAGLALEGKIVYVNTIATFLTRRCFEQVVLDLCMHNVKVRLIGNGGGTVYAPLGATHLAFEDISIMRALPNMTIAAPADANEMKRLMPLTVEHPGPMYIRLGKGYDPIVSRADLPLEIGRGIKMQTGQDSLIITTGITLKIAMDASERLKADCITTGILHLPFVKPLDAETLLEMIDSVRVVVTVEENTITGGLGSAVAEILAEAAFQEPKRFRRIGFPDVFPDQYGSQASLMERYNITAEAVAANIRALINDSSVSI